MGWLGVPSSALLMYRTGLGGKLTTARQTHSRVVLASRLRQGCRNLLSDLRIDDLLAVRRTFFKNVLLTVGNLRDRVGLAHLAVIDEGRESACHGQR